MRGEPLPTINTLCLIVVAVGIWVLVIAGTNAI